MKLPRRPWRLAGVGVAGGALVTTGLVLALSREPDVTPSDADPLAAAAPTVTVYKSPACNCCAKWVEHLEANGFRVVTKDIGDAGALAEMKSELEIPIPLRACHTGRVDGYVIEGHVPADLIERVLRDRPAIAGLAVPGMPVGSPGMEMGRKQPYDVLAFTRDGTTSVYATR